MIIGIDYGEYRHAVCVLDDSGQVVLQREVQHGGLSLLEFAKELRQVATGGGPVRVGIERPNGPLVQVLRGLEFDVFAINPKQIDRWRQFSNGSEAKDDRRDAYAIADALRTKPEAFRRVQEAQQPDLVRTLLSVRTDLVQLQTATLNRLSAALRPQLPAVLAVANPQYGWARELLLRLVSAKHPERLQEATLQKLMRNVRKVTPKELLERLRADKALFTTPSWQGAATVARCALQQLKLLVRQLDELQQELATAVDEFLESTGVQARRDAELIQSMPGVGPNLLAALVAYGWNAVEQRSREPLRLLGGIAPVTHQTGGRRRPRQAEVRQRRACNNTLRTALHHWGRLAMIHDPTSKTRYAELRARGHTFGRAIRQLVDGLLRVMFSILETQQPYRRPSEASA